MADARPNLQIERMKLEIRVHEMELNKKRYFLRIAELDDEKIKLAINLDATEKEILKLRDSISQLPPAEGNK
jgi:hypothetical protein